MTSGGILRAPRWRAVLTNAATVRAAKLARIVSVAARARIRALAAAFEFALSLPADDEFGRLMVQSHASLRDDFAVSTQELDFLVDESMTVRGVYGARMTGAGFGGCAVVVAQPRAVEPLKQHILNLYPAKVGVTPDIYVTTATAGAGVIQ